MLVDSNSTSGTIFNVLYEVSVPVLTKKKSPIYYSCCDLVFPFVTIALEKTKSCNIDGEPAKRGPGSEFQLFYLGKNA